MKQQLKRLLWLMSGVLLTLGIIFLNRPSTAQLNIDDPFANEGLIYAVTATNPAVIRQVTGDVTNQVQNVVAEPVDSFAWDGEGVTPISGIAR
ncbi:MAG: hypothetical protein ACFE0J_12215 [Elainellaceae cyanobacterium]